MDSMIYYELREHYKTKPPTFEEFLTNPIYLSNVGETIYPIWRQKLKDIYPAIFFNPYYLIILYACTSAGKCVTGDTLVSTNKGLIQMDKLVSLIEQGRNLEVYTEDGFKPVRESHRNGVKTTNYITDTLGKIFNISDEHRLRVYTKNGIEWKYGKDIQKGDFLVNEGNLNIGSRPEAKKKFAYLLGIISAFGKIMYNNHIDINLRVKPSDVEGYEYAKYIMDICMDYKFDMVTLVTNDKHSVHIRIYSKSLINFLNKFCTQGVEDSIPEWLFTRGKEDIIEYLSGLYDTSGVIDKGNLYVSRTSPKFIVQLQHLCSALGCRTAIKVSEYDNRASLLRLTTDKATLLKLNKLGLKLHSPRIRDKYNKQVEYYEQSNLGSPIDNIPLTPDILKDLIEWKDKHPFKFHRNKSKLQFIYTLDIRPKVQWKTLKLLKELGFENKTVDYLIEHKVYLSQVESVHKTSNEVYDITVQDTHSYITNGVINHNSTILTIIAAYELCKVLCLKNPLRTYHLGLNDILYFDFHMPTKTLGEQTNWAKFINLLNLSPYFLKEINVPSLSSGFGLLNQNVALELITSKEDTVSKAVYFVGMDEFNEKKNGKVENDSIYKYLNRRMEGRFLDTSGFVPYKFVISSSPKDSSDDLSKLTKELDKKTVKTGNRQVYKTERIPQWLTRGVNLDYSGKKFGVYTGDEYSEPFIIKPEQSIPEGIDFEKVEYVPVEYMSSFEDDIYGAIQDILGIGTNSSGKLYKSRQYIDSAFTQENLFTRDTIQIPFNIGVEDGVKLLLGHFKKNDIKFPDYARCIHVDVALTGDRLGLSSCCIVPALNYQHVGTSIFKDNIYTSDMLVGIESASNEQIPLDVIVGFINEINKTCYPVGLVTYDGFQSAAISQPLDRLGIQNHLQSIDRTKDPYLTHKRAVVSGRYIGVKNDIATEELANVLDLPTKIDHPSDGSKDIADSGVGAFFGCFMHSDILLKNKRLIKVMKSGQANSFISKIAKSGFGTIRN